MAAPPDDALRAGAYWTPQLTPAQVGGVTALVEAATDTDGVAPLSEHVLLHLGAGGEMGALHLMLRDATGRLAGYGQLDLTDPGGPRAEVAVAPRYRRQGYGEMLVRLLRERAPDGTLRLWAHGEGEAAAALARRCGFRRTRVLWQLRRSLSLDIPAPQWPAGVTLRAFIVGQDEEAWIACNARAFAHHPEQGGWTMADLHLREDEPWFDADGFFLAERDGGIVGFHWTKIHPTDPPIGEVYVVGVDPDAQSGGLGKALTLQGIAYLAGRGLADVLLYVDDDNPRAVALYEKLGFTRYDSDVTYETG